MIRPPTTILVTLDGSDFAEQALAPALAMASKFGGTLHLLSAVSSLPIFQPADPSRDTAPGWFAEEGARARAYLEKVRNRILAEDPDRAVVLHLPTGSPATVILQAIRDLGADVVVMTTHGRGALGRAWVGSVTDRVMRESPCPVLLLPTGETATFSASILVPMDASETSEAALNHAAHLARLWESRLTLVTVIPKPQSVAVPFLDLSAETERTRMDREQEMHRYLEARAAPLREQGLRVDTLTARTDEVAQGIVRLLEQSRSGLVVMGTQGRGGMARFFMGSVASRMIRISPVPVMLVPPPSRI
ncbi:universal stress protein [soil metagenome]